MAEKQTVNDNDDTLIRFLLPAAHTRGVIIRGSRIFADAARIHRLDPAATQVFGQSLLASILLLSISKGGMRQVLQLDALSESEALWQRILVECRQGAVRGYISGDRSADTTTETTIGSHMGNRLRISTVRDLGFGQPYISTVEHESPFLADHLIRYLTQSTQIRADIILHGDLAIMIEAMPGCNEEHWFKAIETMAKIPGSALASETPDQLLHYFDGLRCKQASRDSYGYHCICNPEMMANAIQSMPAEQLDDMLDASGQITVTCQYCANHYSIPHSVDPSRLQ
ncbi:MAG: molecular chaperone [Zetaproteobacteria bacterium CG12_big_fil_rev_8_21_14_0_65_54_13]|nr:MAG: molecular chaperone [Zetaproteobacteria bacterium CG23_combo_of_CG06-09_8_20_14_all_54_7]PIW47491.1 MAG: molecular chaperone [Zetaproteobacteria bacterium CG12_big_fil_rev_8_21_14_0_65_54_13]PIX53912.1 MAG: molecular chaperone [Zetaproteobacteria bacterium CG_4_10_14_3_um_filter_54_28]PJA30081.1 MAG: molecular chaperone [Zetaproteobacteria bacterium CG_4_9_14_3_um_filter_54_145]